MESERPIFFDPTQKRWKWVRAASLVLGSIIIALFFGLAASLFFLTARSPVFGPDQKIHNRRIALPALPSLLSTSAQIIARDRLQNVLRSQAAYLQAHGQRQSQGSGLVAAFFVNDDAASYSSLKDNLAKIDLLVPLWGQIKSSGSIVIGNADYDMQVLGYIRRRNADMQIFPEINNLTDAGWDHASVDALLDSEQAQERFWQQAIAWAGANHFGGITLDFEEMAHPAQYADFVEKTAIIFHGVGLKLITVVPPDAGSDYPYARISAASDLVALELYDEHYETPGSVASIGWVAQILQSHSSDIPQGKLLPVIGAHSYDWKNGALPSEETFEEALLAAKDSDATIAFDQISLTPTYDYYDDQNILHHVWMQDGATAFNEYSLSRQYSPSVAVWRLGAADGAIWSFLGNENPDPPLAAFKQLQFNYLVDLEGKGEILQLQSTVATGTRFISYNPATGLIQNESYDAYPTPYTVEHYGYSNKKIVALTFDDGPDDRFTPDILDILKAKGAPATFFVVGENAQRFPDLVKEEYDNGNLVGNHTYTHPNISNISLAQLKIELSATERLIETITGHQTVLFRAPYADDGEPQTPDQMLPALVATQEGYIFVGMNIDPQDWQATSSQSIIDKTVALADKRIGNVILLHDGGADRSPTVAALPKLIDALRARGYTFVSLADLIHKPRAALMPPVPPAQLFIEQTDAVGFMLLRTTTEVLRWLFIAAIVLGIARFFLLTPLAILEYKQARRKTFVGNYQPSVAVVIAAYNEEKVIVKTVEHVLGARFGSHFEVIVVNDGSTDATLSTLENAFGNHPDVQIFSKENGGKARALNLGFKQTQADIIISLDADTLFLPDTVEKLVRHFEDPEIAGVAGNAKVGNRINLLTRWQALEYITSQNLDKRAFGLLNCIIVVPGAVGAWRRSILEEMGLLATDTLAEDTDLTLAVEKQGYKVLYEEAAIGLTEAPDTSRGLLRQRYRWTYGTYQACWKHKDALFNPKTGWLGFVTLPNILIFQILLPLLSPILDLFVFVTAFSLWITYTQHPEDVILVPLFSVLFYYFLFLAFDYLIAVTAFLLEKGEDWRLLQWLFLQRFYYRQLMYYIAIKSIISSVRGGAVGWNKVERKATVRGID